MYGIQHNCNMRVWNYLRTMTNKANALSCRSVSAARIAVNATPCSVFATGGIHFSLKAHTPAPLLVCAHSEWRMCAMNIISRVIKTHPQHSSTYSPHGRPCNSLRGLSTLRHKYATGIERIERRGALAMGPPLRPFNAEICDAYT